MTSATRAVLSAPRLRRKHYRSTSTLTGVNHPESPVAGGSSAFGKVSAIAV
jgi:hypothetical protein